MNDQHANFPMPDARDRELATLRAEVVRLKAENEREDMLMAAMIRAAEGTAPNDFELSHRPVMLVDDLRLRAEASEQRASAAETALTTQRDAIRALEQELRTRSEIQRDNAILGDETARVARRIYSHLVERLTDICGGDGGQEP